MAESSTPSSILQLPAVQSLLLQAAIVDRDTGCFTGAYLAQRAAEEIARRQRYGGRLSLLLAAADEPAAAEGPPPVVRVAARVRSRLRATDLVGRWETDEIVVLLPGTGLAGAARLGRRILKPSPDDTPETSVALSIGIATWLGAEPLSVLLDRARSGLEDARARGGGRVGVS